MFRLLRALLLVLVAVGLQPIVGSGASAQGAQERRAAAEAFDRGTTAFLADDYATAARWFEMANNLAPAAPALLQAIRAHRSAGNELRAGTLALRLVERFPDASDAVRESQQIIEQVRGRYYLIEVICDGECAVDLDGTLQAHPAFFVRPGEAHRIGAEFATGTVHEELEGTAGGQRTLRFAAPEGTAAPATTDGPVLGEGSTAAAAARADAQAATPEATTRRRRGAHPAGFVTMLVLTVASGAVLAWSGVDTLTARDEYVRVADEERLAMNDFPRARQLLEDGQQRELRTNILIGVTGGLGLITVILAATTGWRREDARAGARVTPSLAAGPGGATFGLRGGF